MLTAIDEAQHSIFLTSYIFQTDVIGEEFVASLVSAKQRNVNVCVIVDGVGEYYSWPRISTLLLAANINVVRFLPPKLLPPTLLINLRNHRKILVIDGIKGFTGGMNIGDRHMITGDSRHTTADLHFSLEGPLVIQLETIFAEDWQFVTGKPLPMNKVDNDSKGNSFCRCISDGPNEDLDKISLVMMGAISSAQEQVIIVSPYFLPSREMIASLQSAALRGVNVIIILPAKSNLRFIDWATRNLLWELLQHKVKVFYQPAPFSHTKLFIVDNSYAQIGSANQDPRSLRLNFELNVEIFGDEFILQLIDYTNNIRNKSMELTLQEVDARPIFIRLRDAVCWLFTPYL